MGWVHRLLSIEPRADEQANPPPHWCQPEVSTRVSRNGKSNSHAAHSDGFVRPGGES